MHLFILSLFIVHSIASAGVSDRLCLYKDLFFLYFLILKHFPTSLNRLPTVPYMWL